MVEHRPLSIRFTDELISRLDRISEAMSKRASGAPVKRAHAIRAALERGVTALEGELGISKKRGK